MILESLTAVSPIDGRYRNKAADRLSAYFSEYGLMRYRVQIEIEYFIALVIHDIGYTTHFCRDNFVDLRKIYQDFSLSDAQRIKAIENTTNHDVKAVEYFLRERFDILHFGDFKEYIHFGLTSQDINNTATPLSLKDAIELVYLPQLRYLLESLTELAIRWKDIPMLAHTHGQPASPTRLGKEIYVFVERLSKQIEELERIPFAAKFGGATGNFNAHFVAYPHIDWISFSNYFVNDLLGLSRSQTTTQIEHYDYLAALFDALKRINTIVLDLDRDMWIYISMDYFKQKIKDGEVGSSAMPHKINPIDFENSEGNIGIANALYEHFAAKLPLSRLQRDLTDSTVLRNIGVPIAHSLVAFSSTLNGLNKLILNKEKIESDLDSNWSVVAEAIQTILRREGYPNPYEALKQLTRTNQKISAQTILDFVKTLNIGTDIKEEICKITPYNYTGVEIFNLQNC